MHNQDSPMYKVFIDQCVSNEPNCWSLSVKKLLCDLGLSNVWSKFDPNVNYLSMLCQRLKDQYVQNWGASLENSPIIENTKLTFVKKIILTAL